MSSSSLDRRIAGYLRRMEESSGSPHDGEDPLFGFIRRGKYQKAAETARERKLNPFSLFNGFSAFGRTYDGIPFIAAAMASAVDRRSRRESVGQRLAAVLEQVFRGCGKDSRNMFDAKFSTPNGSDGILEFVLTRDGGLKPSKKYDGELDLDTMVLLHSILSGGYSLSEPSGLLRFVFSNDLITTLRLMVENGLYEPSMDSIREYGIDPKGNIGRMVSVIAPHPFALHEPEIVRDDKGRFAGGKMYDALRRTGYDISDPDSEQKVHPSVLWMVRDLVGDAYVNYSNSGENFTNGTDGRFSEGSAFMDAVNRILGLCSEYMKYTKGCAKDAYTEGERERFLRELVRGANADLASMNEGANEILSSLSLPKVLFVLKNPLSEGDDDVRYRASAFMRELWDSVKAGRPRNTKKSGN